MFALAILPIVIILFLMVGFRWGASRAGGAGYLSALLIAVAFFGAGTEVLAYAHAKAVFLILDVLLIIWTAFLLFRVVDEAGAIQILGDALPYLTSDRGMQALVIGWAFASFLQGVGGFGVPVAVIAPILGGLGFPALTSVVIPSLGHSWSVTFGSLGSSFNALMAATGLTWDTLAAPAALFLGLAGLGVGFMVAHAAGGWKALRRLFVPVMVMGIAMGVGQFLTATGGLWNIGGFIGGMVGLMVGFPLARRFRGQEEQEGEVAWGRLLVALSGYGILIILTLCVQFIPRVQEIFSGVVIGWDFPGTETALGFGVDPGPGHQIYLLRHAGMILFTSSLLSYLIFRWARWYEKGALRRILGGTVQRVITSSVGVSSMVLMAVIMQHAGMTDTLARGVSTTIGQAYPLLSPWMGALGAFMTGSNTNSNLVFAALQMRTADILGISVPIILAAQTAGAALGSVIAPTKVIVGASTAGMAGREGEVMRKMLLYIGLLIALMSALAVIGVILR